MVREKRERKETDKAKTMREQLERLAQLREAARTNREQQQPALAAEDPEDPAAPAAGSDFTFATQLVSDETLAAAAEQHVKNTTDHQHACQRDVVVCKLRSGVRPQVVIVPRSLSFRCNFCGSFVHFFFSYIIIFRRTTTAHLFLISESLTGVL